MGEVIKFPDERLSVEEILAKGLDDHEARIVDIFKILKDFYDTGFLADMALSEEIGHLSRRIKVLEEKK